MPIENNNQANSLPIQTKSGTDWFEAQTDNTIAQQQAKQATKMTNVLHTHLLYDKLAYFTLPYKYLPINNITERQACSPQATNLKLTCKLLQNHHV